MNFNKDKFIQEFESFGIKPEQYEPVLVFLQHDGYPMSDDWQLIDVPAPGQYAFMNIQEDKSFDVHEEYGICIAQYSKMDATGCTAKLYNANSIKEAVDNYEIY